MEQSNLIVVIEGGSSRRLCESNSTSASDGSETHESTAAPLFFGQKQTVRSFAVHPRQDPGTNETRLYAVQKTAKPPHRLCEIQIVQHTGGEDDDYSSFLIKSNSSAHVIGNGKLHTLTEVDPLFFLLPETVPTSDGQSKSSSDDKSSTNKWQPLDQVLEAVDPVLRSCLDPTQLDHLYATMKLGDDDDEAFYKFSSKRALAWLERKQQALEQFLFQRHEQQTTAANNSSDLNADGSFAEGFYMPDARTSKKADVPNAAEAKDKERVAAKTLAKEESIQIVCNYLNACWRDRYLQHLNESEEVLQTPKQRRKRPRQAEETGADSSSAVTTTATTTTTTAQNDKHDWMQGEPKAAKKEKAISAGVKRLAKVNTTGMKKMSSFFAVSAKKENRKNQS